MGSDLRQHIWRCEVCRRYILGPHQCAAPKPAEPLSRWQVANILCEYFVVPTLPPPWCDATGEQASRAHHPTSPRTHDAAS